ncbi:hypothetical protein ACFRU3_42885 [Streptomyces sp. NPDC056910]|uniref:hypothetical protein n=1 Tax=Streptomyces sp. NPDC056910 TaxID=3345964 RepID=UPI0036CA5561
MPARNVCGQGEEGLGAAPVAGLRGLVPQLVAPGHPVTATTTSAPKLGLLGDLDALDAVSVGEAVAKAGPDVVVHQMTVGSQVAGPADGRGSRGADDDRGRGFSNAEAERELGWEPHYPSWRQGFREGLA